MKKKIIYKTIFAYMSNIKDSFNNNQWNVS